jgi:hypothetical protein
LGSVIGDQLGNLGIAGSASTVLGAAWLNKILDPCHPSGGVFGVPDMDASTVTTPQFKTIQNLTNSVEGMRKPSEDFADWDSTAPWGFIHMVDYGSMRQWTLKYQGDFGVAAGFSAYTNIDPGGNLEFIPGSEPITENVIPNAVDYMRLTYAGVTYEPSMPTMEDQGRAVAAQIKNRLLGNYTSENAGNDANATWWYWNLGGTTVNGTFSPTELGTWLANLSTIDERALCGPAKEGAYFPVRWTDPVMEYLRVRHTTGNTFGVNKHILTNPFIGLAPTSGLPPISTIYPAVGSTGYPYGESFGSWMTTVYWVDGLSPSSNYQVVYRFGTEVQLTDNISSPWGPFTHASPMHDQVALEAALNIRTNMDSAFPASYNFLDKLWGVVKNVAGSVLPNLARGIPVVGPALGNLAEAVLGRKTARPVQSQVVEPGVNKVTLLKALMSALQT